MDSFFKKLATETYDSSSLTDLLRAGVCVSVSSLNMKAIAHLILHVYTGNGSSAPRLRYVTRQPASGTKERYISLYIHTSKDNKRHSQILVLQKIK